MGSGEVEVVAIDEDFEGAGGGVGVGGTDEERVKLNLSGEARVEVRTSFMTPMQGVAVLSNELTGCASAAPHQHRSLTQAPPAFAQPTSSLQ